MEFSLNQCEVDISDSQITTYEVTFPLEVIVCELECFLHQVVNVVMLFSVAFEMTEDLVGECSDDRLNLLSDDKKPLVNLSLLK